MWNLSERPILRLALETVSGLVMAWRLAALPTISSPEALKATTEGVVSVTKTELQAMYEVMFTDYPDIVNVAQVQSMLKISRHLAYELIGDGYIPGMKIGNAYRVPKINVIRYALSAGNPQPAA